ncbi:hypothetical protein ACG7TL_004940 [Trametes sanguinea]
MAAKNPIPTQEQLWAAAEQKVLSIEAAIRFLQQRRLIPEGSHAVTSESLVTGLLHLPYLRPAHEFAAEGLIAFTHLAKAAFAEEAQEAVSRAVLERAEDQLTLRLVEHASHVEARMAELTRGVEAMRWEMESTVDELCVACDSVQRAEGALAEASKEIETAAHTRLAAPAAGESATTASLLTVNSAPMRVRRAATLADLLQRQVLVHGATIQNDDGQRLHDDEIKDRACSTVDEMAREGLTPPGDSTVEQAKALPHGDVVFTTSSPEMARWLLKASRTYKLVAERVPVSLDPKDLNKLRALEEAHDLCAGAIARADWIKPLERRFAGQQTAHVLLTISGVDQANTALCGLMVARQKVLVRRDIEELKRLQCNTADDPHSYRCANCDTAGHAAWDRCCPTLRARVSARAHRKADSGFRFFVTNSPKTWVSEEEELQHAPPPPTVWSQQNTNKSSQAQQDLINDQDLADYDILAIQEPYLTFLGLTSSTPHWRVVYPTVHGAEGAKRTRSLLLVNKQLSTNVWNPVPVPHPDVMAITVRAEGATIHVFNLYVDGNHNSALHASSRATSALMAGGQGGELVWLGDFNRHHPAWDDPANHHLFTTANLEWAEVLIGLLTRYELEQALPPSIATLEATPTKNYTQPNSVFCTTGILERLRTCGVVPGKRLTKTDHFPIATTFDMPTAVAARPARRYFRHVDCEAFDNALSAAIHSHPYPANIVSVAEFDEVLERLMGDIQSTIADHVPKTPETPYKKRWWSADLSRKRVKKERLGCIAHRHRADPAHPSHAEYRRFRNMYADHITAAKNDYWKAWIDSVDGKTIWDTNRFLKRGATDGGSARIPPIQVAGPDGRTAAVPAGPYPKPLFRFKPISDAQVREAICALRSFKALGPDAIPNEVYRNCADTLSPILGTLFRATFTLSYYPDSWKTSDTIVLQKPGKSDYTVAKAWRPIALLDCMSKILSRCVADVLVFKAEKRSMLAHLRFGGRAGRTTTDSIHLVTKAVKDAWRPGDVASIVFLNIKSAFPAALPEWLYHNLCMRGVPVEYVAWLRIKLTGCKTRLRFDDFTSDLFDIVSGIDQGCPLSVILYAFYNSPLIDSADLAAGERAVGSMDDVALVTTGKTCDVCHDKVRSFMDREGGAQQWSHSHNSMFSLDKFGLLNCKAQQKRIGLGPPLHLSDGTSHSFSQAAGGAATDTDLVAYGHDGGRRIAPGLPQRHGAPEVLQPVQVQQSLGQGRPGSERNSLHQLPGISPANIETAAPMHMPPPGPGQLAPEIMVQQIHPAALAEAGPGRPVSPKASGGKDSDGKKTAVVGGVSNRGSAAGAGQEKAGKVGKKGTGKGKGSKSGQLHRRESGISDDEIEKLSDSLKDGARPQRAQVIEIKGEKADKDMGKGRGLTDEEKMLAVEYLTRPERYSNIKQSLQQYCVDSLFKDRVHVQQIRNFWNHNAFDKYKAIRGQLPHTGGGDPDTEHIPMASGSSQQRQLTERADFTFTPTRDYSAKILSEFYNSRMYDLIDEVAWDDSSVERKIDTSADQDEDDTRDLLRQAVADLSEPNRAAQEIERKKLALAERREEREEEERAERRTLRQMQEKLQLIFGEVMAHLLLIDLSTHKIRHVIFISIETFDLCWIIP